MTKTLEQEIKTTQEIILEVHNEIKQGNLEALNKKWVPYEVVKKP